MLLIWSTPYQKTINNFFDLIIRNIIYNLIKMYFINNLKKIFGN